MEHILSRSNSKRTPSYSPKRLVFGALWMAKDVARGVRGGLEKLISSWNDPKWSQLLEEIRNRIRNPRYLDTTDAIRDFESLVFVVYRDKLFAGKSERECYNLKKDLLKFVLFLRSLSNTSGLISKRRSGYSAFSHWMEAVYIYLENDPKPTLQGIKEIAAHDAIEDPSFHKANRSSQIRWQTPEKVRQQLIKYGGTETIRTVERDLTKPRLDKRHIDAAHDQIWIHMSWENEGDQIRKFFSEKPELYMNAKAIRNKAYLSKILWELDDITFLKKLADTLSNIRNIDAYVLLENNQSLAYKQGKEKMERKCREIVDYFLSRSKRVGPSYYVQLISELESLKETYSLNFSMQWHSSSSKDFKAAIDSSKQQGIEFVKISWRIISRTQKSKRVVLEARKRKL